MPEYGDLFLGTVHQAFGPQVWVRRSIEPPHRPYALNVSYDKTGFSLDPHEARALVGLLEAGLRTIDVGQQRT